MVKNKRTYTSLKEHGHDMSYENERKHDNVHSPSHYKHGKKETIEVIRAVSYTHLTLPTKRIV